MLNANLIEFKYKFNNSLNYIRYKFVKVNFLMDLKKKVMDLVDYNAKKSGNKCGLLLPVISRCAEINFNDLKNVLNELYKDGFIKVREGINGKLVFKNNLK